MADATPGAPPGLVLAGGAGRRVGGADKGLLPYGGSFLAAHVCARLRPQVCRLVIACNRNRARYGALADALVTDRRPGFCGPLAGVEAALPLAGDRLAVVPCDVPALPGDLVARLLEALQADAADVAYARAGGRDHYLCAVLRTGAARSVSAYLDRGGRSVHEWYEGLRATPVTFADGAAFHNVNALA